MFNQLIAGDTEFKVDPETNFWGTGDTEKLEKLFSKMQKKRVADMQDLRYNTDIILFYVNPAICAMLIVLLLLPQEIKCRAKNIVTKT
jgi:hypothetical protein